MPMQFRHDAPDGLRYAVIQAAHESLSYSQIRTSICRTLYLVPDINNWSEIPNIRDEVGRIMQDAEWYQVYDAIEGLVDFIEGTCGYIEASGFVDGINMIFSGIGAGWQFVAGEGIIIRGDAAFEEAVGCSREALPQTGYDIAAKELPS